MRRHNTTQRTEIIYISFHLCHRTKKSQFFFWRWINRKKCQSREWNKLNQINFYSKDIVAAEGNKQKIAREFFIMSFLFPFSKSLYTTIPLGQFVYTSVPNVLICRNLEVNIIKNRSNNLLIKPSAQSILEIYGYRRGE